MDELNEDYDQNDEDQFQDVIAKDQAAKEVISWLDFKKVNQQKRDDLQDTIDQIIGAVASGSLALDPETFVFTYTLKFPLTGGVKLDTLEFQPRLAQNKFHHNMKGIKQEDGHAMLAAYIATLTGKVRAVITSLDNEDYSVGKMFTLFFTG